MDFVFEVYLLPSASEVFVLDIENEKRICFKICPHQQESCTIIHIPPLRISLPYIFGKLEHRCKHIGKINSNWSTYLIALSLSLVPNLQILVEMDPNECQISRNDFYTQKSRFNRIQ